MLQIKKRNGIVVPFDRERIINAINKAFIEVDGELYEDDTANDIADENCQTLSGYIMKLLLEERKRLEQKRIFHTKMTIKEEEAFGDEEKEEKPSFDRFHNFSLLFYCCVCFL